MKQCLDHNISTQDENPKQKKRPYFYVTQFSNRARGPRLAWTGETVRNCRESWKKCKPREPENIPETCISARSWKVYSSKNKKKSFRHLGTGNVPRVVKSVQEFRGKGTRDARRHETEHRLLVAASVPSRWGHRESRFIQEHAKQNKCCSSCHIAYLPCWELVSWKNKPSFPGDSLFREQTGYRALYTGEKVIIGCRVQRDGNSSVSCAVFEEGDSNRREGEFDFGF